MTKNRSEETTVRREDKLPRIRGRFLPWTIALGMAAIAIGVQVALLTHIGEPRRPPADRAMIGIDATIESWIDRERGDE